MRALTSSVVRVVPVREPTCSRPKGGGSRTRVTRCQATPPAVPCNRRAALAAAAALTLVLPNRARAAPAFGAPRGTARDALLRAECVVRSARARLREAPRLSAAQRADAESLSSARAMQRLATVPT